MDEAYHRALMAFPDEDVVVGSRFVAADALEAFKQLDELIPRPRPPGRWRGAGMGPPPGQALRRRRRVRRADRSSSSPTGRAAFLDHESLEAGEDRARGRASCSPTSTAKKGGSLVAHGWMMAEDLVKLGAARKPADGRVRRRRAPAADDAVVHARPAARRRCSSSSSISPTRARAPARRRAGTSSSWRVQRRPGSGTSHCRRCGAARSDGKGCSMRP